MPLLPCPARQASLGLVGMMLKQGKQESDSCACGTEPGRRERWGETEKEMKTVYNGSQSTCRPQRLVSEWQWTCGQMRKSPPFWAKQMIRFIGNQGKEPSCWHGQKQFRGIRVTASPKPGYRPRSRGLWVFTTEESWRLSIWFLRLQRVPRGSMESSRFFVFSFQVLH